MNKRIPIVLAVALAAGGLAGCENMTRQERSVATGAVVGGVAGNLLTDSAAGTIGGAVVGGVIGNEVGERRDRRDYSYYDERDRYYYEDGRRYRRW